MRRRLAGAISVVLLLISILPPALANAAEYAMPTVARYAVDPGAGDVAVTVDVSFTNTLPDPPGQLSAFDHVDLAIHAGASLVAAHDEAGPLQVAVETRDGVQVASVKTRLRVRYNRSVSFTLSYRLTDGAAPDLHVRPGTVKFPAWGFGTSSQVTVQLPATYKARADGDPMLSDVSGANLELRSGPIPEPDRWLAVITAVLPSDYVTRSASVALDSGTVDLQVRAWKDDVAWGEQTLSLLVEALPRLEAAIGLPYPRVGPLVVVEAAGGEGSAVGLPATTAQIQVAFDGSAFTLLHQAAHLWISEQLAADPWVREGLASHYAARAAAELGIEPPYDPVARTSDLAADARPLLEWGPGSASGAADAYGYAASWALIDRIASAVGETPLTMALGRVVAGQSAYDPGEPQGAGTDGRPFPAVDTRRLLDQLAATGRTDVAPLFREMAFGSDAAHELTERETARAAYAGLLAAAGDWGAPEQVRLAMADWRFDEALAEISEASDWLEQRDALLADVVAAGLVAPGRLRERYLLAGGGPEAAAELDAEQALVDAYVDLQERVEAPRSPLDGVGLFLAQDPGGLLANAADSFGRGDLEVAVATLDRLDLELNGAASDGALRLAGTTVLVALLGLGVGVTLRRRSDSHYTAAR